MLAEWNVELGPDDPWLEIPWSSDDGSARFLDLKRQPELLLEIPEACMYSELADFLSWANSEHSPLESAKCDTWSSREINVEDEVFGEPCKFGSYIDILFASSDSRSSFADTEAFAQGLARLLRLAPEMGSSAELTVRRCVDRRMQPTSDVFYITFYLHGYGEDEREAQKHWGIALKTAQSAIMQLCARPRDER